MSQVYPQIRFAYPISIAPTNEKDTYNMKMRYLTNVQTAAMAGKVVVGPAIRKANPAAGLIPCARSPLTMGSALRLLVYTGIPKNVAVKIAHALSFPIILVIHS